MHEELSHRSQIKLLKALASDALKQDSINQKN